MKDSTSTGCADASIDAEVALRIAEHYCHARRKHPYFADMMFLDENDVEGAKRYLGIVRTILNIERKKGELYAETLVNCEVAEICDAIARGHKDHAVDECYDAIAVLLRMADVLEGRQKLGKPKEGEALSDACYAMFNFLKKQNGGYVEMANALDKAKAALAKPPRNCDVGTAEEQSTRFDDHCRKHMGCLTCPLREKDGGVPKHCELAWAQIPYEEGGTE